MQLRGGGGAAGVVVSHGQALDELGGEDPLWVDWRPDWTTATPHTNTSRLGVILMLDGWIVMEWWKKLKDSSHTDELRVCAGMVFRHFWSHYKPICGSSICVSMVPGLG